MFWENDILEIFDFIDFSHLFPIILSFDVVHQILEVQKGLFTHQLVSGVKTNTYKYKKSFPDISNRLIFRGGGAH